MAQTNHRILKNCVIALAHQAAFGTPAATSTVLKAQALKAEIDPGYEYIHPRGTTGSLHPKDTHLKVSEMPSGKLELPASPKLAAFFLEYATGGQPAATLANGDLTEAGDSGNDLSAWALNGVRPSFNTDSAWKIYAKLEDETPGAGQARVSLYSDSARTALVAQGSAANNNTITLAEQNSSGLSGTVALAAPSASNLTGIVLTIVQVRPQFAGPLTRFFTCWRDHGSGTGLERLSGCAVEKFARVSEENGLVRFEVDLLAGAHNFDTGAGGTFSANLESADKEYYLHGTTTLNTDVDSGNVAQHALKIELAIENDLEQIVANAATVDAILKRGTKEFRLEWTQKLTDEAQVVAVRGLNDTFERVKVVDTFGARTCTFDMKKVKSAEPAFPEIDEEGWGEVEHKMQVVEETAASPTLPILTTVML